MVQCRFYPKTKWNISGLKLAMAERREGSCIECKIATGLSYPKVWVNKINNHVKKWEGISTRVLIKALFSPPAYSVSKLATVSSDRRLVLPSPLLGYADKEVAH